MKAFSKIKNTKTCNTSFKNSRSVTFGVWGLQYIAAGFTHTNHKYYMLRANKSFMIG